jgi:6-phosphogluconate dehydrogenase
MPKNHIAMIGLAVMGANLARNIASRGYSVAVYNRTKEVTEEFARNYQENLNPYYSLRELVDSLERPRTVMIMVKAGKPVDAVIDELIPSLEVWDIIIDCGNSHYQDTIRREKSLREKGFRFVGCGVSGGEEWALHGPSIMPGCEEGVYAHISPILESIAARDFSWGACVTHTGPDGAWHYVKMVHNGIEYAVMQMIAEAYEVYRKSYGLRAPEIGKIFEKYNTGVLDSYLIEITGKVLARKDNLTDRPLVDIILDRAWAKGTGLWTSIDALESGMSVSSIVEATFARMISSDKKLRTTLWAQYEFTHSISIPLESMREKMEYTLYLGMLFAYAQWLALIRQRSLEHHWDIDLSEVTRIWQGGCIIRSQILTFLTDAFHWGHDVEHIFALAPIHDAIESYLSTYQEVLSALIQSNIATPALSSALQYFTQIVTIDSSANMIQWLRDHFGAHTYERVDREGVFHTEWGEDR